MSCLCCTLVYDLGCFGHCDTVDTPLVAAQPGDHIIQWEFDGIIQRKTLVGLLVNDDIDFPATDMNEYYTHKFKVVQPDGTVLTYTDGEDEYDCFMAEIRPVHQ